MNKLCSGCNRELPATPEYFHRKNNGFVSRCKECIKKYHSSYYQENHKEVKEKKVQRSKDYYDKNKETINSRRRKHYSEGTSAKKGYMDSYYENNRESILQKRKVYLSTDEGWAKKVATDQVRRARQEELESTLSASEWKACKAHFENKCAYCGNEKPLTREHFIPLVKGGEYTINNIIPACKSCNSSKRNSDFFMWYPKQEFYMKEREQKILKYLNYKNNTQQLALL